MACRFWKVLYMLFWKVLYRLHYPLLLDEEFFDSEIPDDEYFHATTGTTETSRDVNTTSSAETAPSTDIDSTIDYIATTETDRTLNNPIATETLTVANAETEGKNALTEGVKKPSTEKAAISGDSPLTDETNNDETLASPAEGRVGASTTPGSNLPKTTTTSTATAGGGTAAATTAGGGTAAAATAGGGTAVATTADDGTAAATAGVGAAATSLAEESGRNGAGIKTGNNEFTAGTISGGQTFQNCVLNLSSTSALAEVTRNVRKRVPHPSTSSGFPEDSSVDTVTTSDQKGEMTAKEAEVSRLQHEQSRLQQEQSRLQQKLTKHDSALSALQKQVDSSQSTLSRLQQEIQTKELEKDRLKGEMTAKEAEVSRLQQKQSRLQQEQSRLQQELTRLQQKLTRRDSALSALQERVDSSQSTQSRLQQEIQTKELEKDRLKGEMTAKEAEVSRLQQKQSRLQQEQSRLQQEQSRLQQELTRLQQKLTRRDSALSALQERVDSSQSTLSRLQQEIQTKELEKDRLKGEMTAKEAEVSRLQHELSRLQQKLSKRDSALSALQERVDSSQSTQSRLQQEIQTKELEKDRLKGEMTAKEAEVSQLQQKQSRLQQEQSRLQEEVSRLQQDLSKRDSALSALQERVDSSQSTQSRLKQDLEKADSERRRLQEQLDARDSQLSSLRQQVKRREEELSRLQDTETRESEDGLEVELTEVRRQLENASHFQGQMAAGERPPGGEDLERFDLFYGRGGKIHIFPDVPGRESRHQHPQTPLCSSDVSSVPTDPETRRRQNQADAVTEHREEDEDQLIWRGPEKEAKALVIERTKAALEEIKSPDDPPIFLLHNQHLGGARNVETDVLVLHPKLGVLVLAVKTATEAESGPCLDDVRTRLLQAQEVINEEMGDLLEKDAVVMIVALPAFQQEVADVFRQNFERERQGDHAEIRLLCGSTANNYREMVRQLSTHRASSGHAFKGCSGEDRHTSYRRACIRRCSVAGLCSGKSVNDSADLQPRVLLTQDQLRVRDSQAELLHVSGPAGSGKTMLLVERARRWVDQGRRVALAVSWCGNILLLGLLARSVCGEKANLSRVSTHRDFGKLLQWLDTVSTEDPAFIILDETRYFPDDSRLVGHVTAGRVHGLWTAHTRSLCDEDEAKLRTLGETMFHLQGCFRCPHAVTELANTVKNTKETPLLPPSVPVMREQDVGVKLICHPDHPQAQPRDACSNCKEEARTFVSSLGLLGDMAESDLTYNDCIVLTTHQSYNDRQRVADWLQALGIPAVAERETWRDDTPVLLPGVTAESSDQTDLKAWMSRVSKGTDREGNPVMHVIWSSNFQGLQRRVVLLWHEDREDENRERQGKKDKDMRLFNHRCRWFRAATCCQEHLAVVVATPTPLLSLLQASNSAASTQH